MVNNEKETSCAFFGNTNFQLGSDLGFAENKTKPLTDEEFASKFSTLTLDLRGLVEEDARLELTKIARYYWSKDAGENILLDPFTLCSISTGVSLDRKAIKVRAKLNGEAVDYTDVAPEFSEKELDAIELWVDGEIQLYYVTLPLFIKESRPPITTTESVIFPKWANPLA